MPDLLHAVTKYVDHNRWTAAGLALAASAFAFTGCSAWDGRVVSSQTGETVSAEERDREFVASIRTVEEAIAAEKRAIAEAGLRLDDLIARAELLGEDYTADRDAIDAELAERNARLGGLINIAKPLLSTVPGGEQGIEALLIAFGLGGTGYGVGKRIDNRRKDRKIAEIKAGRES